MNMVKTVAAAVTLALSGGVANAALESANTGAAELLLNIYDAANNIAYSQDLGVSYADFAANIGNAAYSLAFTLDSSALSVLSGSSNLVWNIGVAQTQDADFGTWGYLTTMNPGSTPLPTGNGGDAENVRLDYNDVMSNLNLQTPGSAALDIAYANNNNQRATEIGQMTNSLGGSVAFNNSASTGTAMRMYQYVSYDAEGNNGPRFDSAGLWSLDLSGGTVNYAAASVVPVPAALWLLLSGLVGMGTVSRRRSGAAA